MYLYRSVGKTLTIRFFTNTTLLFLVGLKLNYSPHRDDSQQKLFDVEQGRLQCLRAYLFLFHITILLEQRSRWVEQNFTCCLFKYPNFMLTYHPLNKTLHFVFINSYQPRLKFSFVLGERMAEVHFNLCIKGIILKYNYGKMT